MVKPYPLWQHITKITIGEGKTKIEATVNIADYKNIERLLLTATI